jgi:hypothetical protein
MTMDQACRLGEEKSMARQDELERYEQTEARDILRWFAASRPSQEIRAPAGFRTQILRRAMQRQAPQGRWRQLTLMMTPVWAPALTAALVLSLAVNVWLGNYLLSQRGTAATQVAARGTASPQVPPPPHAYTFQAGLAQPQGLGAIVAAHAVSTEPMSGYGFAAKPAPARAFHLGATYAETLAYARSGDAPAAAQHWRTLDQELTQVLEPLATYMRQVRSQLAQPAPSPEELGNTLALFEPLYEAYAERAADASLTLFRAGTWLTNMRLATAMGDTAALRTPNAVQYFQLEMARLQAPKGVLQALERLQTILAQNEISRQDVKVVQQLVIKMQRLLG